MNCLVGVRKYLNTGLGEDVMDCPECGRKLPGGKKRCIYCGGMAPDGMDVSAETDNGGESGRQGENRTHVEEWTVSHAYGDVEKESEAFQGNGFEGNPNRDENNPVISVTLEKSKSIKPMNRVVLVLIFFASMAVMGALVWLIG